MSIRNQSSSYFSDDPHLRGSIQAWRWHIPIWIIAILTAVIRVGLLARPGCRAFREHRVDLSFRAAPSAASAGEWGSARDKARSVLLARSDDFAAFGIWARALSKLAAPDAYLALARLGTDSRATRADRFDAVRMRVAQAPHAVVFAVYASMPEELRRHHAAVCATRREQHCRSVPARGAPGESSGSTPP